MLVFQLLLGKVFEESNPLGYNDEKICVNMDDKIER